MTAQLAPRFVWQPGQTARRFTKRDGGVWLPALTVALYFLSVWRPTVLPPEARRWYIALAAAAFAYVIQSRFGRTPLTAGGGTVFWAVCAMNLAGAGLALFRASDPDDTLWRTVALGTNYLILGLYVPVLATPLARRLLLAALIAAGLLWSSDIAQLSDLRGQLHYATFEETGGNKNLIGFSLTLGGLSLLHLAVRGLARRATVQKVVGRLILASGGAYLLYHMALIYARSGILTAAIGALALLGTLIGQSRRKLGGALYALVAAVLATVAVATLLPSIRETSPQWDAMYPRLLAGEDHAFYSREMLLKKGLYLVSENPLIGVGAGGSLAAVRGPESFPAYLIHNSYLTDWAEFGILGLLSNAVWIVVLVRTLRARFSTAPLSDQVWLLLFFPLLFQMGFAEMNTVSVTMLAILAGIRSDGSGQRPLDSGPRSAAPRVATAPHDGD